MQKRLPTIPARAPRLAAMRAKWLAERATESGIDAQKIVEVGVFQGWHARALCHVFPAADLFLVDPWGERPTMRPWVYIQKSGLTREQYWDRLWHQVRGDFAGESRVHFIRHRSLDAVLGFADGSVDIVYLDAAHEFGAVCRDIHAWLPKVKPGGLLAGHDYFDSDLPRLQVKRAVNHVLGAQAVTLGPDGSWLMRRGAG